MDSLTRLQKLEKGDRSALPQNSKGYLVVDETLLPKTYTSIVNEEVRQIGKSEADNRVFDFRIIIGKSIGL